MRICGASRVILERILSKAGGGRKRRASRADTSGTDIYVAGDSQEAAAFIGETAAELSKIANRHGLDMLAHLLDMTQLEADDWLRHRRRLS